MSKTEPRGVLRIGAWIALLFIVAIAQAPQPSALPQVRPDQSVVVAVHGQSRVGFVPNEEPYVNGFPRVAIPIERVSGVATQTGRPVTVLEFIGWREADGARVLVYGLAGRRVEEGKRFLGSTLIPKGEAKSFEVLDELGFRGIEIRYGVVSEAKDAG